MSLEDRQADVYGELQVLVCHFDRKFNRKRINGLFKSFDIWYERDSNRVYHVIDDMEDEIKTICEWVGITHEQLRDFRNLDVHEDIKLKF
jgi:hypothetical protein